MSYKLKELAERKGMNGLLIRFTRKMNGISCEEWGKLTWASTASRFLGVIDVAEVPLTRSIIHATRVDRCLTTRCLKISLIL